MAAITTIDVNIDLGDSNLEQLVDEVQIDGTVNATSFDFVEDEENEESRKLKPLTLTKAEDHQSFMNQYNAQLLQMFYFSQYVPKESLQCVYNQSKMMPGGSIQWWKTLFDDRFHILMQMSMWKVLLSLCLEFVVLNTLFACFYSFQHCLRSYESWGDAWWFSSQTATSVGYLLITPHVL